MKHKATCALITGASQGLGRAFAEECAGRGMALVLAALPGTGLAELAGILDRAYRVPIEVVECDLTRTGVPGRLVARAAARGFDVDTLVNNAGVGFTSPFAQADPAQNEATVQLNVAALVRLTQEMLPVLAERRRAWILNVASLGAFFPMPSMPLYSSTKAFVLTFTRLLRAELADSGVSVSALCPNGIRTNRATRELIDRQGWAGRLTCRYPDEVARAGLRGLYRGTAVIVPGLANRLLAPASRFVPQGLYMKVITRRWAPAQGPVQGPSGGQGAPTLATAS
jgi:uncharacterized protein